jgi:pimeloyl-ACP methyl ester carboxylesterase
MHRLIVVSIVSLSTLLALPLRAEDWKPIPRKLPPVGIKIPDGKRLELETAIAKMHGRIEKIRERSDVGNLVDDVEIYHKALQYALINDEFYAEKDIPLALSLVGSVNKRLDELEKGEHSWTSQHGALARGYTSRVDGSVQPYGLEIPEGLDLSKPVPLYVWLHGRGDTQTDFRFIRSRETGKGQIHPPGAIVMHAFGRNCLGFKSAGETDVFEAIDAVKRHYKIDPDRVVLAGFSMGGAGAWHLGAHYADQFVVVHPGAGFVDVAKYQKLKPDDYPVWYEQTLWGLYDVPDYVRNLFNTTTIAYSGEIDAQRAAAELMVTAFKEQGRELTHLIGPKMPHKYDPAVLAEVLRRIAEAVEKGRDNYPKNISLQTRTLRYNRMFWASLTALNEHWKDSRLDAEVTDDTHVNVTTRNADGIALQSPWPAGSGAERQIEVRIDGSPVALSLTRLQQGAHFIRTPAGWDLVAGDISHHAPPAFAGRKVHGLQGPIDDAFMDAFLVVTPSGKCASPAVQKWVDFELAHFQERWRAVFRGDLRMKRDTEVTPDDIQHFNLVIWGDPASNSLLAKVVSRTPVTWSDKEVGINGKKFDAATHVPLMIYPNPLNAAKYVVFNSGPTFREAHDHTNSLQNPKLPDWAVIDITVAPDGRSAGQVEAADFFDESWQVRKK